MEQNLKPRYALIGCGRIASRHIRAALDNGLQITAVCDHNPEQMEHLLKPFGLGDEVARYTHAADMLDAAPFDLVAIATESGSHAALALDCIDRRIPVLVEKPLALSMDDANAIVSRSEARKVPVCVCHQNRFNPAVQALRRAVEQGRFGKLSHGAVAVRWNRGRSYYGQADWRGRWASDGGALMNQCIHGIDLLRWMLGGQVTHVYGATRRVLHPYLEAEDLGLAVVHFADGTVATIEGTTNVYPKNLEETLCVFGERGTVKLGGTAVNRVEAWSFADSRPEDGRAASLAESTRDVYGNGHTPLYANFLQAMQSGSSPLVDARAGRDALELVLAVYKSQREGKAVDLPLSGFSSVDMKGVFD